jgi:DNA (cytosine-5)-methyltransferase 1
MRALLAIPGETGSLPNHYCAKLSEVDLQIAAAVKPGENWKAVPEHIPCKRIETIRQQFKQGLGSRSTYYGRLHPDRPAYTINTYFNRPGNGCHLHYDFEGGQHRTISQREAARIQSFPDSFVFHGNRAEVFDQIGNAVPPLLAYQIASKFGKPGGFVDLFCGAGGLALGFKWAGWTSIVGNDIDAAAVATYQSNIHPHAIVGDIRKPDVFRELTRAVTKFRESNPTKNLVVVGGPPCQGFSTAGKPRSMEDARNNLFYEYKKFLTRVKPTAFVFENVTGLLNMEGGRVFALVRNELQSVRHRVVSWVLGAEKYGVPQRRTRVFLLGWPSSVEPPDLPSVLTNFGGDTSLFESPKRNAISVREALDDLPRLVHGEDGSGKDYVSAPMNDYQRLMRGKITARSYITNLS